MGPNQTRMSPQFRDCEHGRTRNLTRRRRREWHIKCEHTSERGSRVFSPLRAAFLPGRAQKGGVMVGISSWRLNRLIVSIVLGGFLLLLIEVRYLHDEVLLHHAIAWTPIVYSGLMSVGIIVGLLLWDHGGRRGLFWAFAAALFIGPLGYWFHNDGQPWRRLKLRTGGLDPPCRPRSGRCRPRRLDFRTRKWRGPSGGQAARRNTGATSSNAQSSALGAQGEGEEEEEGEPPSLAPLSISGLGLLGMLACAGGLQPGRRHE